MPSAAPDSAVTNPIALPGPNGTITTRFKSLPWPDDGKNRMKSRIVR